MKKAKTRQRDDLAEHHPPDSRGQGVSSFAERTGASQAATVLG
jgi:hypothetical protein